MDPKLNGTALKGGFLNAGESLKLGIHFNCLIQDGNTFELELVIELPYYSNPNIIISKQCPQNGGHAVNIFYVLGFCILCYAFLTSVPCILRTCKGDEDSDDEEDEDQEGTWSTIYGLFKGCFSELRALGLKFFKTLNSTLFASKSQSQYSSQNDSSGSI